MRSPSAVAEQIRDVVPEEHKERFARLIESFCYKPLPEQTGDCWNLLSRTCNELLGGRPVTAFSESWQVEMIAILTDKEVEL